MIVAGDEASLYLQATRQAVWHPRGLTPVIKLHPGRENSHFYGGLNLQTGQEVVMRSPVMNAETSALFLHKLLTTFTDQPILLLWDRTPWQQGVEITTWLKANPRLEIFFFPTAAPDLNPQEHVWKAARGAVSHNHTYIKLDPLAKKFEDYLETTTFPCPLLEQYGYLQLCMMFK